MDMEKILKTILIIFFIALNFKSKGQNITTKDHSKEIVDNYQWITYSLSTQNKPHEWACEPSISANPIGKEIIAGSVLDQIHRTNQNGASDSKNWSHQTLKSPFGVWGDPILQYDNDGRVYFLHLSTPNGKKDGEWKEYDVKGELQATVNHVDNLMQGEMKIYYKSGGIYTPSTVEVKR